MSKWRSNEGGASRTRHGRRRALALICTAPEPYPSVSMQSKPEQQGEEGKATYGDGWRHLSVDREN